MDEVQLYGLIGRVVEVNSSIDFGGYLELDTTNSAIAGELIDFPYGSSLIAGRWTQDRLNFVKQYRNDKSFQVFYEFFRIRDGELWQGKYRVLRAGTFEGEGTAVCKLTHFANSERRMVSKEGLEFPIFLDS